MLLVTFFEAFGGRSQNSSALFVESFARSGMRLVEGQDIAFARLPVSYQRLLPELRKVFETYLPTRIVCLGEAAKAECIRLEEWAENLDRAEKADNEGETRQGFVIRKGLPERLPSGLRLGEIEALLKQNDVPFERSQDAGGFLCNHVFYQAVIEGSMKISPPARAGFIHLPLEVPDAWARPLWRAIVERA